MLKSLGATGLLLVGGGTTAVARSSGIAADDTRFRAGHFPPDAPSVDVYVNGDPFPDLQGVPFGALSGYFTVPAGTYQVEMTPIGDVSTVVIDTGVTFRRNRDYTVAVTDVFDAIMPVVFTNANHPIPYGETSVRVVHFLPDAPEVDIVVKGGLTLFSELTFGDVSQYETVSAGTYDLQVVLLSNGVVVLDLFGTMFPGDRITSVFAVGFATGGSPGLSVLPMVDVVSPACKPKPPSGGDVCHVG